MTPLEVLPSDLRYLILLELSFLNPLTKTRQGFKPIAI